MQLDIKTSKEPPPVEVSRHEIEKLEGDPPIDPSGKRRDHQGEHQKSPLPAQPRNQSPNMCPPWPARERRARSCRVSDGRRTNRHPAQGRVFRLIQRIVCPPEIDQELIGQEPGKWDPKQVAVLAQVRRQTLTVIGYRHGEGRPLSAYPTYRRPGPPAQTSHHQELCEPVCHDPSSLPEYPHRESR